jgi:hypothetical protein
MQGDSDHTTTTTKELVGSGKSPLQEALEVHKREWYDEAPVENGQKETV